MREGVEQPLDVLPFRVWRDRDAQRSSLLGPIVGISMSLRYFVQTVLCFTTSRNLRESDDASRCAAAPKPG